MGDWPRLSCHHALRDRSSIRRLPGPRGMDIPDGILLFSLQILASSSTPPLHRGCCVSLFAGLAGSWCAGGPWGRERGLRVAWPGA